MKKTYWLGIITLLAIAATVIALFVEADTETPIRSDDTSAAPSTIPSRDKVIGFAPIDASTKPAHGAMDSDGRTTPQSHPKPSTSNLGAEIEEDRLMTEATLAYQSLIERQLIEQKIDAKLGELTCADYICSGSLTDGSKEEYKRWGELFARAGNSRSMNSMMYGVRRMRGDKLLLQFEFNIDSNRTYTNLPPAR